MAYSATYFGLPLISALHLKLSKIVPNESPPLSLLMLATRLSCFCVAFFCYVRPSYVVLSDMALDGLNFHLNSLIW